MKPCQVDWQKLVSTEKNYSVIEKLSWFIYLSQLDGYFSHNFFRVGFKYLWKTSKLPLLCGWYGAENILSIPNCFSTWSIRVFLNSVPLSKRMYMRHVCTGRYWLMKVEIIVSADLSGMGNASSHPVRWSMILRMCLFPEVDVSLSITKSVAILSNGLSGISVIVMGRPGPLPFPCSIEYSWQCIS